MNNLEVTINPNAEDISEFFCIPEERRLEMNQAVVLDMRNEGERLAKLGHGANELDILKTMAKVANKVCKTPNELAYHFYKTAESINKHKSVSESGLMPLLRDVIQATKEAHGVKS